MKYIRRALVVSILLIVVVLLLRSSIIDEGVVQTLLEIGATVVFVAIIHVGARLLERLWGKDD